MKKSKRVLSVVLALVIALSTIVVSGAVFTASALEKTAITQCAYLSNGTVDLRCHTNDYYNYHNNPNYGYEIARLKKGEKNYRYFYTNEYQKYGEYNDNTVVAGTIYYYQARAYLIQNGKKSYGPWSKVYSVTTLYYPTINSMYNRNTFLNINWNKIKGATKFRLAFKRDTDTQWNYRYVTKNYYNVPNPTKGRIYYAQVQAINGDVYGPWSMPGGESIESVTRPVLTSNRAFDDEFIDVYWYYNAPNPAYFIVYYKKASDANWTSEIFPGEYRSISREFHKGTGTLYFQVVAANAYYQLISPYSKVYSFKR